jgi:hypothetical protein
MMDAARYVRARADDKAKLGYSVAVRMAIAEDLRTLADEIESGDRLVNEIQTQEGARGSDPINSQLFIRSTMERK